MQFRGTIIGLHSGTSQSEIKSIVHFRPVLSRNRTAETILGLNSVTSQSAIKSSVVPLWNRCDITTVQPYSIGLGKFANVNPAFPLHLGLRHNTS